MVYYNMILEGCDGVGKTSIFDMLLKTSKLAHLGVKAVAPKSYQDGIRYNRQMFTWANNFHGIIFDRFMLGERVYAPIYRDYYPTYMDGLESKLKDHNVLFLITCDADIVMEYRFDGRDVLKEDIPRILESFLYEFKACHYPHKYVINTTIASTEQCVRAIIGIIEKIKKSDEK